MARSLGLRREDRKIALLVDSCSAHDYVEGLTQIKVIRLPQCWSKTQPQSKNPLGNGFLGFLGL